jgi:hypothetical protein
MLAQPADDIQGVCCRMAVAMSSYSCFLIQPSARGGYVMALPRCWEIMDCGRQSGGSKVGELGVCNGSIEGLGYFCWAIAGTLCGEGAQCARAQRIGDCLKCEVYVLRHGYLDDDYARICDSDINHVAELLSRHHGEYARICPVLRSDGPLGVESAAGRDIWWRIVKSIDESELRTRSKDGGPDV